MLYSEEEIREEKLTTSTESNLFSLLGNLSHNDWNLFNGHF